MTGTAVVEIVGYVLALFGALVFIAAAVGLIRFRDPYMRISAVATAAGIGIAFITLGAALTVPTAANLVKAVVAVIFQLATSAMAAILIARAAVNSGHEFTPETDTTDLESADRDVDR
ncbi:MAG: monovalent cation/H(+) antiporter subunit G, partial [Brachybacterium sp.]|nr:monovalent cation/H(+) antiporter subunit G [Brachybacterium sp.]